MKVLLVANDFLSPMHGGNIRARKFAKYLSRYGCDVHVVCKAGVPVTQPIEGNEDDLQGITIHRVDAITGTIRKHIRRSNPLAKVRQNSVLGTDSTQKARRPNFGMHIIDKLERYCVPDFERYNWSKRAIRVSLQVIEHHDIRNVVTTAPPFSTHMVGLRLKTSLGEKLNWIADFRDLWTLSPNFTFGRKSLFFWHKSLEARVLRDADHLVFVSSGILRHTRWAFQTIDFKSRASVVTNGVDLEDFNCARLASTNKARGVKITYLGTVFGPRIRNSFPEGIAHFISQFGRTRASFKFIGSFDQRFQSRLMNVAGGVVTIAPFVTSSEALIEMSESDVLSVMLTDDLEGSIALTGKFFEILAAKRHVLALVPEGEISHIVRANNIGEVARPSKPEEIAKAIDRICVRVERGEVVTVPDELIKGFDRSMLARQILCLLR